MMGDIPHIEGCPPFKDVLKKNVLFTVVSFFTEVSLIYWGVPHIEECPPFKDVLKMSFFTEVSLSTEVSVIYWSVPNIDMVSSIQEHSAQH